MTNMIEEKDHTPTLWHSAANPEQLIPKPIFGVNALSWLYATPSAPDCTDIFNLNEDNFGLKGMRNCLENKPFEMEVGFHFPATEWINHFYFEAKNNEKVFGKQHLGVGYPYLMKSIDSFEVCAPLFFWELQIEPHAQEVDKWIVYRSEKHGIRPNYPLFHLIDFKYQTDYYRQVKNLCERKTLNTETLAEITNGLCLLLQLEEQGLTLSNTPFPSNHEVKMLLDMGALQWSAVIGHWRIVPETLLLHEPVFGDAPLPSLLKWDHQTSPMYLDSNQRLVLHRIQEQAITVVQGASGTGKTYTLAASLLNALSNGKKCLVVSNSLNSLRRVQHYLNVKGVGELSFVLRDTDTDKSMLLDVLRATALNRTEKTYDAEKFTQVLNKFNRLEGNLDGTWKSLHQSFFKNWNFTTISGHFLRADRAEGKELLTSQLNASDFEFTEKEYSEILKNIAAGQPLFQSFPVLYHPLSKLHPTFFKKKQNADNQLIVVQKLDTNLAKAKALHQEFIEKINHYSELVTDNYEEHYKVLLSYHHSIIHKIEDGRQEFGDDFSATTSAADHLLGVFSDKLKKSSEAKTEIFAEYESLKKTYNLYKYFDFDFPTNVDAGNMKKLEQTCQNFHKALVLWRKRIPALVREDIVRLSGKNALYETGMRESFHSLEERMEAIVADLNQSSIFAQPLRHEMLTMQKRQQFMEHFIQEMEQVRFHLRDFNDYYTWQYFWVNLPSASQKVLEALCKLRPRNWKAAFESWYFYQLLLRVYVEEMEWETDVLKQWEKTSNTLNDMMPSQIQWLWRNRKRKALTTLEREDSTAYETWFGKSNQQKSSNLSSSVLFKKHQNALTETLPVLLCSTQAAIDMVKDMNVLFDVIYIDEAHNIRQEEAWHLFDMGKNIAIFGDAKQDMTPEANDDLLEYCLEKKMPTLLLDYQHQACPEEWLMFNQIAFQTPFRRVPSGLEAKDVTFIESVGGIYNEQNKTNEEEARKILDWLNNIAMTESKVYPLVGIACSTVQQRDLISAQLLKIRQRKAPGFEKIIQLYNNGLGVYHFSELQGQHFDVLLISFTHGPIDYQGNMTKDLALWNTIKGINELHIALTRATKNIYIAHSYTAEMLQRKTAATSGEGVAKLISLVNFAHHIQDGNAELAEKVLEQLKKETKYSEGTYPVNTFMEEVEIALQPYFEAGRIVRNGMVAGVKVPMMILPLQNTNDPVYVLMFDNVLNASEMPSYRWETLLRNYFRKHEVAFVPTLSSQWWKNPRHEAKKLAQKIAKE